MEIEFTPTIPHCSMATLIGLSIKVKLLRSLPDRFKVCVCVCGTKSVHLTTSTLVDCWSVRTTPHIMSDFYMLMLKSCPSALFSSVSAQVDVHITPGTHASEEAGQKEHAETSRMMRCYTDQPQHSNY